MERTTVYLPTDLLLKAKAEGINISQLTRECLIARLGAVSKEQLTAEIEEHHKSIGYLTTLLESLDDENERWNKFASAFHLRRLKAPRTPTREHDIFWINARKSDFGIDLTAEEALAKLVKE